MSLGSGILRKAAAMFLPRNGFAFRVARKIVNLHHGDNDCELETNGELRLARAVLPQCRVIFDVGANVGDWTSLALEIQRDASYHCFEPSVPTFALLKERAFPSSVRRNAFGLSDAAEQRKMFVYAEGLGSNSLYFRTGLETTQELEETVSLRTIDDYCAEQKIDAIDFMKIDVEGHELSVLRGARQMLTEERIGLIQFEYGGCYVASRTLLKDIWDYVLGLSSSYSFYKLHSDGPHPVPRYDLTLETFQYSNWVVARKDWAPRLGPIKHT